MNSPKPIAWIVAGWLAAAAPAHAEEAATVELGYEFAGLAPYPMSSKGYRLAYGTDGESEVEVARTNGRRTILLAELDVVETEVRYRRWLSPIAYAGLGLGWREVDLTYDVFVTDDVAEEHVSESHKMATVTAHFGVELVRLGWFVLGTDMFGASVPFHRVKSDEDYPDGAAGYEEDPKVYPYIKSALGMSFHLVRTYLVVRF